MINKTIFQTRIDDDEKRRRTITIDKRLHENLEELKHLNKIRKLSPRINGLLWTWFNDLIAEYKDKPTEEFNNQNKSRVIQE